MYLAVFYGNCITSKDYKLVKCFLVEYFVKTIPPYGVLYFDPEVETRLVKTCCIFVLTNTLNLLDPH